MYGGVDYTSCSDCKLERREVSVLQHHGGQEGPHVEAEAEPGGDDLDPDGRHVCGDGLYGEVVAWCVPVGQRHHDVECGQGEHQVEQRPGVLHTRKCHP